MYCLNHLLLSSLFDHALPSVISSLQVRVMVNGGHSLIFEGLKRGALKYRGAAEGADVQQLGDRVHQGAVKQPDEQLGYDEAQQEGEVEQEADLHVYKLILFKSSHHFFFPVATNAFSSSSMSYAVILLSIAIFSLAISLSITLSS